MREYVWECVRECEGVVRVSEEVCDRVCEEGFEGFM